MSVITAFIIECFFQIEKLETAEKNRIEEAAENKQNQPGGLYSEFHCMINFL